MMMMNFSLVMSMMVAKVMIMMMRIEPSVILTIFQSVCL